LGRAHSWIEVLTGFLVQNLARIAIIALVALVLYGVLPPGRIAMLLILFVLARGVLIIREALQKPLTRFDWENLNTSLLSHYGQLGPEELAREARKVEVGESAPPYEVARAATDWARRGYVAPRAGAELACEGLGLVSFGLLLPANVLLYTRDFVSFQSSGGWITGGVVVICLCLYAWPFLWAPSARRTRWRMQWWGLPFLPALVLLAVGISIRHPYLDPLREDRKRLAAERVLALESNIQAGPHADWVFDYARELEEGGDPVKAIHYYREGLRLDPYHPEERARLAALEYRVAGEWSGAKAAEDAHQRAYRPLLEEWDTFKRRPRCQLDSSLGKTDRTSVVMVRIGDVDDGLLDAIGEVIHRELGLSSCVVSRAVPLPSHTRTRGLLGRRQWSLRSLVKAFFNDARLPSSSPVVFLLVTPVDIYDSHSNYMFAASYSWGALVSFARFGDPSEEKLLVARRAAKQALGSIVKAFGVRTSPDTNCVTSYPRNLEEFDAKGNRPNAESLALFQRALRARDRGWAAHRAKR
jgi:predicted Zn-dependent protease